MFSGWLCQLPVALLLQPTTSGTMPPAGGATTPPPTAPQPVPDPARVTRADLASPDPVAAPDPAAADGADDAASDSADDVQLSTWSDRVTFGGLVDSYLSAPLQGDFRQATPFRAFDAASGSFILAYTEVSAAVAAEPAGLRLDLGFGPVADLTSLEASETPGSVATSEVFKHVEQAYASFKQGVVTIDFGKFVTSAGAEVVEAKDNWCYSRSFLFWYAIPVSHTGLRVSAAVSDKITVQASLVNGWDVVVDPNDAKTVGASVLFTNAPTGTTASLNMYVGKEIDDTRFLADAVLVQKLGDNLAFHVNGDFAVDGDFTWWGVAGVARFVATERLAVAVRGEHFQDPDGFRIGVPDSALSELTATVSSPVGSNAEVRIEGRVDLASEEILGAADDPSKSQATVQFAGLAWF